MTFLEALEKLSRLVDPDGKFGIPDSVFEDALQDRKRFSSWEATTAYAVGDRVVPEPFTGRLYRCAVAGTSGATAPDWPTGAVSTSRHVSTWKVEEGETLVWEDIGPVKNRPYDFDGAAYDVCMAMARRSAGKVDVQDNGVSAKRSQNLANWTALAAGFSLSVEVI